MTWVRLADDFYDHPKLIGVGAMAGWLWVCGLAYANRYLTDGYLPQAAVRRLADVDDPFRLAARLVDARLWETADGGYRIHDYAEFQPSSSDIKAQREQTAERVREWRRRHSNGVSNASGNAVTNAVSNGAPGPGPGPGLLTPDPAGTTPQPPPAEGELTKVSPEDRRLWKRALGCLPEMTPSNREQLSLLEPLGRAADGGLRLRAPPGQRLERFRNHLVRALADAGDPQAQHVAIVEQ